MWPTLIKKLLVHREKKMKCKLIMIMINNTYIKTLIDSVLREKKQTALSRFIFLIKAIYLCIWVGTVSLNWHVKLRYVGVNNLINVFCFNAYKYLTSRGSQWNHPHSKLSEVVQLPLLVLMLLQTPVLLLHRWGSLSHVFTGGRCLAPDPHRIGQDDFYLPNAMSGNTDRPAPLGGESVWLPRCSIDAVLHRRLFIHGAELQFLARLGKPCLV